MKNEIERPRLEILLILEPGHESLLADSIDALAGQSCEDWRLCVFASTDSPAPEFTAASEPVRWIRCAPENLAENVNRRVAESSADWFGLFDAGTRFPENAFSLLGDYIGIRPHWRVIYTDDGFVPENRGGGYTVGAQAPDPLHSSRFKPDLSLEFLRATDYVGGFFIEKHALVAAGGFSALAGAERYDLLLRAIDALGEAAIGHIPEILVHPPASRPLGANDAGATEALRRHFERRKIPVSILPGLIAGETRRVVYLHETKPKVSIIIPTRNRLDLLAPCIESLLRKTFYPNWELLIVDNDSDEADVHAYYARLCELLPGRVKILSVPGGFDFSTMNNRAAREATGDYLLLLNNDTECLHGEWLDAMMSHAQRPDVGIVGARLLFPRNLSLQHAGKILGMDSLGTAGHVFFTQPHEALGYMNRAVTDQEYSGVTGACLLIRASIFQQIAGFDPLLTVLGQDDDLCLKVVERGYRIIWTPFATLIHHGSASSKDLVWQGEALSAAYHAMARFIARWRHRLFHDPFWNRHLSFRTRIPSLERELAVPWNPDFHEFPRVLLVPANLSASNEHRCSVPLRELEAQGRLRYATAGRLPDPVELDRMAPDVLLVHEPTDDGRLKLLPVYKTFNPEVFRVCLLDGPPEARVTEGMRLALQACNRLIVRSEARKAAFLGLVDDIRVIPDARETSAEAWLSALTPEGSS